MSAVEVDADGLGAVVRHDDHGRFTLAIAGEVDTHTSLRLRTTLAGLFAVSPTSVCLDLQQLDFMDSAGINLLVHAAKEAERHGCEISIVGATAQVARVLALTGVDRLLQVERS